MPQDHWNPAQYQKFTEERSQPFFDLVKMIQPRLDMRVIDLGCGTGHLTKQLHEILKAKETLGIDSSAAMLEEASTLSQPNLQFRLESITDFAPQEKYDLVFSNAALQWVPNHPELFKKLVPYLEKEGQLAIQMPSNFDYPTHTLAQELGQEAAYQKWLPSSGGPAVLHAEEYAQMLFSLGFKEQSVRIQIYPHVLESTDSLVDWVKGTLLTYYQGHLPPELFDQFLNAYSRRIKAYFGDVKPMFLPFKRILLWARL